MTPIAPTEPPTVAASAPVTSRNPTRAFLIAALVLTAIFALPLWRLFQLALHSEVLSYILLIPFISLYLWRQNRRSEISNPKSSILNPQSPGSHPLTQPLTHFPEPAATAVLAVLGLVTAGLYLAAPRLGFDVSDALTFSTLAYLLLLGAAALRFLGWGRVRPHLFPLGFLLFMVPLPESVLHAITVGLQYASAEAASLGMNATTMPVLRDGLAFKLPGISIYVAEECSGIRSTLVLFIVSVLAGYLFLRKPWSRALVAALVFPLGILRNAFRITTIAWLTVNVDSGIIDSPLHHRGGPLFFALSLVPLVLLVLWLRKRECRNARAFTAAPSE